MNRRDFNVLFTAAGAGLLLNNGIASAQTPPPSPDGPVFAMLVQPKMILLDLLGPMTVFNITRGKIHLVWKDQTPVSTDVGIPVTATTTFKKCPRNVDVFFIPGGLVGSTELMEDAETLAFVREMAAGAKYVTAVCTGSLVLGAAGLLKGKRATTLWNVRDLLPTFGAIPVNERVVEDGNLITGGGTTAGIDFGLSVVARLRGEDLAKRIQLIIEYDPKPPFDAGSPDKAGPDISNAFLKIRKPAMDDAKAAAQRAARKLSL
ncbi:MULTISPECIES: DJ-1/PfpI family protein [Rhizobium/Agrobacterium group]|uniref:DJ-1/PfpI family protein n=1 Tax=Rhizobium/Agrobacterium group TaxID=227290 RepID=UPI000B402BC2|nr:MULTISPECIES: DJ-1/PfpI family protein [Rhizobium/Agrobacterium group]MCF1485208.1 DJ-1/PfpI family protein [Allorhizobium ampelinum]NSZ46092.1 DJ-1/PfpI family protein [Agrobacterium vitis]NTA29840.1 DJ-1/PfpI family protein [Allorhizobium ampelinum]OVE87858.1 thiamine biosynthesis protein ThiJ [Allorhizobium ampelinum]